MLKTYCVLYGTMLLDYESNEAAETSMTPRCVAEIIGVSDWDGKGRANKYQNAFLVVTHTGGNYYMCASSTEYKQEWILHIRRSLECNFANLAVLSFKASKALFDPRESDVGLDNDKSW